MYINIDINKIKVSRKFSQSLPKREEYEKCRAFYEKNGYLDRDILVGSNLTILDGYIGYLVLKNAGVTAATVKLSGNNTYVYGVHDGCDKEYCWKVTENTRELKNMRIGGRAIVGTRYGNHEITITRIEEYAKLNKYIKKRVIEFI